MTRIIPLILAVALMLTGCQSGSQSSNTATTNKDSIVISLSSEPETGFDPCLGWGRDGNPLIQSTLVKTDSNMDIVNDLATNYSVSEAGLSWTFTIRDDVKFSDGTELTAHDVAFTFETAKNSGSAVDLTMLESVEVIDDYNIKFNLSKPQITFIHTIAQTGIVPKDYYSDSYLEEPVGSGAFTLLQWNKGEQVILGINPYYYGEMPDFQRVTILFMSDESGYAAAKSGQVDLALTNMNLASSPIEGMELVEFQTIDNRGLTLPTTAVEGQVNSYGYPIGNNVTSDIAIRQALSYGIDRQLLVEDALNGYGTVAYSECDGMPWSSEDSIVDYNPEYSIKLLENAGWILGEDGIRYKEGVKAEFNLLYNAADTTRQALAVAVSNQAKSLGIEIVVQGKSWDEIEKEMHSKAVLMGFGSQNPMESYYLYHSSNKGVDFYNPEYYHNQAVDSILETALLQTDYQTFINMYKQVQWDGENGVSALGDAPFVWLVNVDHLYFVDEKLNIGTQKIHPHGHSWPVLSNLEQWSIED